MCERLGHKVKVIGMLILKRRLVGLVLFELSNHFQSKLIDTLVHHCQTKCKGRWGYTDNVCWPAIGTLLGAEEGLQCKKKLFHLCPLDIGLPLLVTVLHRLKKNVYGDCGFSFKINVFCELFCFCF